MADLTVTAARLRPIEGIESRFIPMIAGVAITKGQAVYRATAGTAALGIADAAATSKLVGIATTSVPAGSAFEAMYHGRLAGFDLSGMDPGDTVFLSPDTAGALSDELTVTLTEVVVPVGTVHVMTDMNATKFLFVDIPQNAVPVALS